jgi:5-methylcytosine-specific restriction endonuclease McrA
VTAKALKKKCDKLWREKVLARAGHRCEICGSTVNQLHAHHLISRSAVFFRHNLENGVCLCASCHTFGFGQIDGDEYHISAHGTPWAFELWMQENKPDQYEWWCKNRHAVITGVKIDYEKVYAALEEA